MGNYRKSFEISLGYAVELEDNIKMLKKYEQNLKDSGYKYGSEENFKNCLLFAGALMDENMGFDDEYATEVAMERQYYQDAIRFSENDWKLIRKMMEDLCNTMIALDKKAGDRSNIQHYKDTYFLCKDIITELYKEEHGLKAKDFISLDKKPMNRNMKLSRQKFSGAIEIVNKNADKEEMIK